MALLLLIVVRCVLLLFNVRCVMVRVCHCVACCCNSFVVRCCCCSLLVVNAVVDCRCCYRCVLILGC